MHASGDSPWHSSAKHHILEACFFRMTPFRSMLLTLQSGLQRLTPRASPVKVILPLSICYTTGLRHRLSGGGHHAGQSVRTFCGEKSHFRDGAWHAGTRLGSGSTRCLVCPDSPEAVHPHRVVFDCL